MLSIQDDKDQADPIFVVGKQFSGTSMMLRILGRSQTVFRLPTETLFFGFLPKLRRIYPDLQDDSVLREYVNLLAMVVRAGYVWTSYFLAGKAIEVNQNDKFGISDTDMEAFLNVARHVRDHGRLFQVFCDYLTELSGRERWVEKTPSHILHIDEIVQVIPNARFIEMVRDPRDLLASKKIRNTREWRSQLGPKTKIASDLYRGFDPFLDTLSWRSAISAGNRAKNAYPDYILRIKYEHLVKEPEYQISRICDFLNLQFRSEMLDVHCVNVTTNSMKNAYGIRPDAIGKWQHALNPESVAACQWVARKEMDSLNYVRTPVGFSVIMMMPLAICRSCLELARRLYTRWQHGGLTLLQGLLVSYYHRARILAASRRI